MWEWKALPSPPPSLPPLPLHNQWGKGLLLLVPSFLPSLPPSLLRTTDDFQGGGDGVFDQLGLDGDLAGDVVLDLCLKLELGLEELALREGRREGGREGG
jgi:hypothetical protein